MFFYVCFLKLKLHLYAVLQIQIHVFIDKRSDSLNEGLGKNPTKKVIGDIYPKMHGAGRTSALHSKYLGQPIPESF